jgi:hypothetical protein
VGRGRAPDDDVCSSPIVDLELIWVGELNPELVEVLDADAGERGSSVKLQLSTRRSNPVPPLNAVEIGLEIDPKGLGSIGIA